MLLFFDLLLYLLVCIVIVLCVVILLVCGWCEVVFVIVFYLVCVCMVVCFKGWLILWVYVGGICFVRYLAFDFCLEFVSWVLIDCCVVNLIVDFEFWVVLFALCFVFVYYAGLGFLVVWTFVDLCLWVGTVFDCLILGLLELVATTRFGVLTLECFVVSVFFFVCFVR